MPDRQTATEAKVPDLWGDALISLENAAILVEEVKGATFNDRVKLNKAAGNIAEAEHLLLAIRQAAKHAPDLLICLKEAVEFTENNMRALGRHDAIAACVGDWRMLVEMVEAA